MSVFLLRRTVPPLILALFCSLLCFGGVGRPRFVQPVALSPASSGGLYVLDVARRVEYVPGNGSSLDASKTEVLADFRAPWQVVDMAAVHRGSNDRIYVLLASQNRGMLLSYSNRKFERSWMGETLLGGIAPDPAGHRVFLSGSLTSDIFYVDVNNPQTSVTKVFAPVPGSQILGPLAVDSSRHVLYAGDERLGTIYAINLESKAVSTVAQIQGQPSALAFDAARHTLYVTDSVGQRVWAIEILGRRARTRLLSNSIDFRLPSAITIDSSGTVWVGDPESKAVFRLSSDGAATPYRPILQSTSIPQQ